MTLAQQLLAACKGADLTAATKVQGTGDAARHPPHPGAAAGRPELGIERLLGVALAQVAVAGVASGPGRGEGMPSSTNSLLAESMQTSGQPPWRSREASRQARLRRSSGRHLRGSWLALVPAARPRQSEPRTAPRSTARENQGGPETTAEKYGHNKASGAVPGCALRSRGSDQSRPADNETCRVPWRLSRHQDTKDPVAAAPLLGYMYQATPLPPFAALVHWIIRLSRLLALFQGMQGLKQIE